MPNTPKATPARRIEYLPLDDVRPADRNPKEHDRRTIRESLRRFGYVEVMTRDDRTGRLVAGHGRYDQLRAARSRDPMNPPDGVQLTDDGTWLVPVLVGWASRDDEEAKAYLVTSNRSVETGGWDESMLAEMVDEMMQADAGLTGTGFTLDDAIKLISSQQPDDGDEFDGADTRPQLNHRAWKVIVDCDDEEHQSAVIEQLQELGLSVRAVMN